jgi:Fanconi anemia group M protein
VFINQEFIKKDHIDSRQYQINIAKSVQNENSLVVLPTGLGKTIIALMLISIKLKSTDEKILFLAPTKPLVTQHSKYLKENLTIKNEKISIFTGEVSPEKRKDIWQNSRIVVSTPQVIENDLLSKRLNLKKVNLIIFDECHHAVGDYSYVYVSEVYKQHRENRLVLGITASPGNDLSKILEVCKNLEIKNIEIRTKYDPDVKPYVHDLEITWKEIKLPDDFAKTIQLLRKALSERLKFLKNVEIIESSSINLINKTKLLDAQKKIQTLIKSQIKPPKALFRAAQKQSEAMKIHYSLELLQTQGVKAFLNYFERMGKEASKKGSTKASRALMADSEIIEAITNAKSLNLEHPKILELIKVVKKQFMENKNSKIIVFSHYRDTSSIILTHLSKINRAKPVRFIGQASKENDKGLTQKQQSEIVDQFKKGVYNVLIATSVAEEGLDIPSTDMVVFYEPIPSEIRLIQRRGRTARKMAGKVVILITKGTPDEGYYWSAKNKEKRMRSELEYLRTTLRKRLENPNKFFKNNLKSNQKTLTDYQKNSEQIRIEVDHREYRSNVVKNLNLKGTTILPKQLDVGDYILSTRTGVERKEVDDYLNSLLDGKLFKQISMLKQTYARPILIIEGNDLYTQRNINQNAIMGSLATITVNFGVPVMMTKDAKETAELLCIIAKREQKDEKKSVAIRDGKYQMSLQERQRFLIEGLPNVSAVLAQRLLSHFGSIRAIANTSEEELKKVEGIGKNIAKEILNVLNTEYMKD